MWYVCRLKKSMHNVQCCSYSTIILMFSLRACLHMLCLTCSADRNQEDFWKLSVTRWRRKKEVSAVFYWGKIGLSVTSTHAASLNRTHCIMTLSQCAKILQLVQICRPQLREYAMQAVTQNTLPLHNIDIWFWAFV